MFTTRRWVVQLKACDGNGRVITESERSEFRTRWRASAFAHRLRHANRWSTSTIIEMPELSRYPQVDVWQEIYR